MSCPGWVTQLGTSETTYPTLSQDTKTEVKLDNSQTLGKENSQQKELQLPRHPLDLATLHKALIHLQDRIKCLEDILNAVDLESLLNAAVNGHDTDFEDDFADDEHHENIPTNDVADMQDVDSSILSSMPQLQRTQSSVSRTVSWDPAQTGTTLAITSGGSAAPIKKP